MTFPASVGKLISARPAPISGGCAGNHLLWTVLSWGGSGLHGCPPLWTSKVAKAWFSEGSDSCRKWGRNPHDLLRPRLGTGTLKCSHSSTGQKGTWLNPKSRARRNFKETSYIGSWCGLTHLFYKQGNLKLKDFGKWTPIPLAPDARSPPSTALTPPAPAEPWYRVGIFSASRTLWLVGPHAPAPSEPRPLPVSVSSKPPPLPWLTPWGPCLAPPRPAPPAPPPQPAASTHGWSGKAACSLP